MEKPKQTSLNRKILALALPALGSLIAEPLLTMTDSILVGHVGTPDLAGLAIGSTVLTLVVGICVFLAYTTTAVTGRAIGGLVNALKVSASVFRECGWERWSGRHWR